MARELQNTPRARKSKLPSLISPQLATLVKEPPSGDEWLHELKFDGYRMLCRIDRGRVSFWSRNGKDWTEKFLNVVEAVKSLKLTTAILDGEVVIVDAQGRSSFQKLQRAMGKATTSGFAYEIFDLIYLDGFNLTRTPLKHRKELLKSLVRSNTGGVLRYSEHIQGSGMSSLSMPASTASRASFRSWPTHHMSRRAIETG